MQIVTFLLFTILVAVISYLATRKTNENSSDGYFLGGRSLTGIVIAGSLLLTNLSTEQIVGLNGQAYEQGILVMAWETIAAITMVIIAVFLLPRYLKGGIEVVIAEELPSSLYRVIPKIISKAIKNKIKAPATAKEFTSIPIKFNKLLPTNRKMIIKTPAIIEAFSD